MKIEVRYETEFGIKSTVINFNELIKFNKKLKVVSYKLMDEKESSCIKVHEPMYFKRHSGTSIIFTPNPNWGH